MLVNSTPQPLSERPVPENTVAHETAINTLLTFARLHFAVVDHVYARSLGDRTNLSDEWHWVLEDCHGLGGILVLSSQPNGTERRYLLTHTAGAGQTFRFESPDVGLVFELYELRQEALNQAARFAEEKNPLTEWKALENTGNGSGKRDIFSLTIGSKVFTLFRDSPDKMPTSQEQEMPAKLSGLPRYGLILQWVNDQKTASETPDTLTMEGGCVQRIFSRLEERYEERLRELEVKGW